MSKLKSEVKVTVVDIDLARLGDDWEDLVSAGQVIVAAHDRNRWKLGDLGCKVERRYGEASLGKFAHDIGYDKVPIYYQYVQVARLYTDEDRAMFPQLSWSHYRAAMAAGDHGMAMTWLAKAADNGWFADEIAAAMESADGNPPPREAKLLEFGAEYVESIPSEQTNEDGTAVYYDVRLRTTKPLTLTPHRVYTAKIYGAKEQADDE